MKQRTKTRCCRRELRVFVVEMQLQRVRVRKDQITDGTLAQTERFRLKVEQRIALTRTFDLPTQYRSYAPLPVVVAVRRAAEWFEFSF